MLPSPGIAKPKRGQQMQGRCFGPAIRCRNANANIFDVGLGVLNKDIEVAVLLEDPGIQQLVFGIKLAAPAALGDQRRIGILALGILVQILHVGVRRSVVEVEIALLDVFAVVALVAAHAEEPFFEDGVASVPQRQGKAQHLMAVADSGQAIFIPAIGARAGMVVGKMIPCGAVGAVVLADRAPLPLGEVRAPLSPRRGAGPGLFQTPMFDARRFHEWLGCEVASRSYPFA